MTSLVPTLRTDKNGRTQIRHMRSDAAAGGGSSIPVPSLSGPMGPAPHSDEHLFALLKDAGFSYLRKMDAESALSELRADDPDLLPLAAEMAATGTSRARELVLARLDGLIEDVIQSTREASQEGDSDGWSEYSEDAAWPHGRNCLIMAYHLGGVLAEIEASDTAVEGSTTHRIVHYVDFLLRGDTPGFNSEPLDHEADAARCRGMAAYCIAGLGAALTSRDADCRAAEDFIEWAGQQEDITEVIAAAEQARTADPSALAHLVKARRNVEPALRGGAL